VLADDVAERAGQVRCGLLRRRDRRTRVEDRRIVEEHRCCGQGDEEVGIDGAGDDQSSPVLHASHTEQNQADERIHAQNVAGDQEDPVQAADHEQAAEPPQHPRPERCTGPLRRLQLQLEAVPEQEREQQVELHVHERRRQPVHRLVEPRPVRRILGDVDRKARRSERDVHDQNAQQGETTQPVDVLNPRPIPYLAHALQHTNPSHRTQSPCLSH
jgi:hypothetical protein